jgi:hypothetical protein
MSDKFLSGVNHFCVHYYKPCLRLNSFHNFDAEKTTKIAKNEEFFSFVTFCYSISFASAPIHADYVDVRVRHSSHEPSPKVEVEIKSECRVKARDSRPNMTKMVMSAIRFICELDRALGFVGFLAGKVTRSRCRL